MQIFYTTFKGTSRILEVSPKSSVRQVIASIVKQEGIEDDAVYFTHNGRVLSSSEQLVEHVLNEAATLDMRPRMLSCSSCACSPALG